MGGEDRRKFWQKRTALLDEEGVSNRHVGARRIGDGRQEQPESRVQAGLINRPTLQRASNFGGSLTPSSRIGHCEGRRSARGGQEDVPTIPRNFSIEGDAERGIRGDESPRVG